MILAIDPGKDKTGLAVMDKNMVVERLIIPSSELLCEVERLSKKHGFKIIVTGDGTAPPRVKKDLAVLRSTFEVVAAAEKNSTLEARKLYFNDHPPAGILRLIPRGLLFPPVPVDDYAAVVLGRRYLNAINP
ncbi:MAG: pre-16S rRNA-processing nuclease YqgF [Candidatus Margulisiibacteriota bacterium]|nr:pre-16S rRNA-processing nuclease YqgF [Candidatus Margulisiibacteriota bacterium]